MQHNRLNHDITLYASGSNNMVLYSSNITLYGNNNALYGNNIALNGNNIAYIEHYLVWQN